MGWGNSNLIFNPYNSLLFEYNTLANKKQINMSSWAQLFTGQKILRPRNYIIALADEPL